MSVKFGQLLLILLCLAGHSMAQITILPVFDKKPIVQNTWFVTKNGDSIQFDNIRFYLSDIQFVMDDKTWIRDTVKAHLIDIFESDSWHIAFQKIDLEHLKAMRFNIGIDSLTNVSGALSGDLDPQRGMYWAWQSGYINLKIEGRSPQCKKRKNIFHYHIGGYLPPFYSMRTVAIPIKKEWNSNAGTTGKGIVLQIDFSKFFENITIATQNSMMMPCKEAMQLADYSASMFSAYAPAN
jgi:hypothetical protein